jgi:FkbM family methyltransferase
MKYDFVEIGTCYYDTCVDEYGLDSTGLLVEPVKEFYDVLPYSKTVLKENCAITDKDGEVKFTVALPDAIKYISGKIVKEITKDNLTYENHMEKNGDTLVGGWSSVSTNAYQITPNVLKKAKEITVKSMSFLSLVSKYDITEIDYLKIDTEGCEAVILKDIIKLLNSNKIKIDVIRFEYNKRSDMKVLDELIQQFAKYDYSHHMQKLRFNSDCILTYRKH